MSFQDLLVSHAELLFENHGEAIISVVVTVAGFLLAKFYNRIDSDRDELVKIREFVGVQKRENAAIWKALDEIRGTKR